MQRLAVVEVIHAILLQYGDGKWDIANGYRCTRYICAFAVPTRVGRAIRFGVGC